MKKRDKILIVDDSEINRSLLVNMLSGEYDLMEAGDGVEAISKLDRYHSELSLVLLDIVMPNMDGFEVLARMNRSRYIETIPVIMISAETSSSYMEQAYCLGAAEYISRPFEDSTVKRRIKNIITLYARQKRLEQVVTEQLWEKEKANLVMVEILSQIVEFRNGESGLHVLHIRVITEALLKRLSHMTDQYALTPDQIALISNASALHDIGKISIPDEILNKPGRLTQEEFEFIKGHSAIGAQMLENIQCYKDERLIRVAHDICRWHHERYDGKGYPDGLKGEEIPISTQVVAVADVYDALTSRRAYKEAYSHETALRMILDGECGTFNPLLLDCLEKSASYLKEQVKMHSVSGVSKAAVLNNTRGLLQNSTSNRTVSLLEQERTKYQFFASMSKEIQFEYSCPSQLLTLSEWGAEYFGINAIISDPWEDSAVLKIISKNDLQDLHRRLLAATRDDPIVSHVYCLHVKGEQRWCKLAARPLWEEDSSEWTRIIGKFTDVYEEQIELNKLEKMAQVDALTGLFNCDYARSLIETALSRIKKIDGRFALLLFDLDLFKNANDQYGRLFGDKVLGDVGKRVRNSVRMEDISARIGGDEFLIFMEYNHDDIYSIVDRVHKALSGQYHSFEIGVSMGVALAPEHGAAFEELFLHADQALHAAKQNGRRHYRFYDGSMQDVLPLLTPMDDGVKNRIC
ncbi:diguanylate cyclase [Clostridium sp. D33t1_170424_F3]|uniref:diguanylate cyclase n=1 Tax=Clostridium sp. D33t1_170424_F3 TaxID=2787099 RepID=UPI0018A9E878|nr:diguanylate cyclase [Clostridium sp. D33t1_170424_F3]